MESKLIFLLLGLTCVISVSGSVTTAHTAVIDEIWKESSDILHIKQRYRRETMDDLNREFEWFLKNNETFCFCGKKNWVTKLAEKNITKTIECVRESKLNLAIAENDKLFNRLSTIAKASKCAYDCIFKSHNLLTSEGLLNNTAVRELFMDNVFVEKGLKETATKVLDRCLSTGTGNPLVSTFMLSFAGAEGCKNDAYKFIICLFTEFVNECPEKLKRNDAPLCKKLYDNMEVSRNAAEYMKLE